MFEVETVSAEMGTIKMLVVGEPGSGKTLTASTWPNPLYIDFEGRMLSVRDRNVKRVRVTNLKTLEEVIRELQPLALPFPELANLFTFDQ